MLTDPAVELWDDLSQLFSGWEIDYASSDQIVGIIRAALDAARAEERAACVEVCRARVGSLTEECLRLKWDDDRRSELTARAEGAYDCAEAIRGRG